MPGYAPSKYPPVAVTVDMVLLTVLDDTLAALLIRRGQPPYKGRYALPGGFIQPGEDLASAAARELEEETGARGLHLEPEQSRAGSRRGRNRIDEGVKGLFLPGVAPPLSDHKHSCQRQLCSGCCRRVMRRKLPKSSPCA